MAVRIVGVDLPQNKRGEIGLTYIFGIGRSSAAKILNEAGVDVNIKVKDWFSILHIRNCSVWRHLPDNRTGCKVIYKIKTT